MELKGRLEIVAKLLQSNKIPYKAKAKINSYDSEIIVGQVSVKQAEDGSIAIFHAGTSILKEHCSTGDALDACAAEFTLAKRPSASVYAESTELAFRLLEWAEGDAFYSSTWTKLNLEEKGLVLGFLQFNLMEAPNKFEANLNRMFLDQPKKPKRWALIQDLLSAMNKVRQKEAKK